MALVNWKIVGKNTWRPLPMGQLLSQYRFTDPRVYIPITVWALLLTVSLMVTAYMLSNNWLSLDSNSFALSNFFVFNPALIIGLLLLFWLGFDWGFIPIYLSAFIIAIYSDVTIFWSSLIGVAFILGLGLFALAYHSIQMDYSLRNLRSIAFFVVISFVAALASSMGSFIWSLFHQLSAQESLLIWKSWWTGIFFQSIFIGGPLLFLLSPKIESLKEQYYIINDIKQVSQAWIYSSVAAITITLALFIYSGSFLGKMYVEEIARQGSIASLPELMGAVEAFEIITWTSIGIILLAGYTAVYLLGNWNKNLREEVRSSTKSLVESREKLRYSLEEKEILMNEIQHRVKNNLAQVHSLLELQEITSDNEEVADLLKISRSRIRTMALAHEELYNNNNYININLRDYVKRIAESTHRSYSYGSDKVSLELDLDDLQLDISKVVPVGLMISEIIINAHKHAFNKAKKGVITINTSVSDEYISLAISDNGSGMPKNYDIKNSNSLGMMLIEKFTEQIDSEMDIESNNKGTTFTFKIPVAAVKA